MWFGIGREEKSAMRLPFKVDANDNLLSQLKNTLGEECVVLKVIVSPLTEPQPELIALAG